MFSALVVFLLLGYPVAFALAANGLVFALVGIELGLFRPDFLQALPERVYGVMNNDTLLAIPFFTFMGLILERSGMAEDLLDTIGQLFGTLRGGLPQWPAKFLIPLGFMLLMLQAVSELIKRIAIMRGDMEDTTTGGGHHAAAEAEAQRLLEAQQAIANPAR